MMARTQVTLDPETRKQARERAAQLGISLAEYVRRLLRRDLVAPAKRADATAVFDLGRSGGSNVARDKDRMAGEAATALRGRGRGRGR